MGYESFKLPSGLVNRIDRMVSKEGMGYTSRAEFVKEAVRAHLDDTIVESRQGGDAADAAGSGGAR
jgi:Arc/MetJ-type ribon-helix-helix transcriptional regulator